LIRATLALAFLTSACLVRTNHEPLTPNTLADYERASGVELLFDGKSTAGWRGYKQASAPAGWQAVDGALVRAGEGGDLVSAEEYQDFVFDFEWQIAPGGNSGVIYHASEDHDYPWETGPEYQILDNGGHKDGLDPRTSAASNYAMHAPLKDLTRPVGEWNQGRILVCVSHVEHWLNGVKVVEYELGSDDWKARVAQCKWKDRPDYGQRGTGHIVLQDHGDRVAFRNLKIQRISRSDRAH
jgi:hypothetical protein